MHFDIYSIFNPPPKDNLTSYDFKVSRTDVNGLWIKLDEIQTMVESGIIQVDYNKLKNFTDSWRNVK